MTTHVHLLCSMLFDSDQKLIPIRKLTHSIKSYAAHEINKFLKSEGAIWEEESFDRGIRSEANFYEKLEYIRMNPIRAGLVKRAEDYRWFWQDPAIKVPKKRAVGRT
jgi:putative transposase